MKGLIALLVLYSMGCANMGIPAEKPYYNCMLMYGNRFRCYPQINYSWPELERTTKDADMIGAMCLMPEDFATREAYVNELEERLKDK